MLLNCPFGEWACEGKGAVFPLGTAGGSNAGSRCVTYCRKWCTLDLQTGKAEWSDSSTTAEAEMQKWSDLVAAGHYRV
jgi:hypothetical protein